MTDPPIPDAPGLPPGTLAYAEWEGRRVSLVDTSELARVCSCQDWSETRRYVVGSGPDGLAHTHVPNCPVTLGPFFRTGSAVHRTDDYTEALAVWQKHADALAGRGEE